MGYFSMNLGVTTTFCAALLGVMDAIEIASRRGWMHLWLEVAHSLKELLEIDPSHEIQSFTHFLRRE